ncbi:hypothetical protein HDV06_004323 [Boothiomyces sp. JEL0866]|nr:hypothetical protein HDV06_004323 [Boothiomyces sp. JEL0866]
MTENEQTKKKNHFKLEAYLKNEKKAYQEYKMQPKLLILGSSDSGKSTLLKQMKIMHGNGFTDEEKRQAGQGIRDNILTGIYHFLEGADKYLNESYIPNNDDILMLRTVTQHVSETIFTIKKKTVRFFDVSGLIHHRKTWLSYFDDVQTVLFVMSLASYDQFLAEDSTINMMVDSLVLFEQVINNPILSTPNFVLFFNKKDIYEKKIKIVALNSFFPEYTDKPHSASKGVTFIKKKFLSQIKGKKSIVCHITCATDTGSMQVVLETMLASILEGNLRDAGVI